jgi:hypothetical protein
MNELSVRIVIGKNEFVAAKAMLKDLIGAMGRLRWKDDASLVFSSQSVSLMQWVREVRNGAVHEGEEVVAGDERTIATLLAQISGRLWQMHRDNSAREVASSLIQKDWQ